MTPLQVVLGSVQLFIAILLSASVALQSAPDSSGSMGALTGDSGGFFGRSKSKTRDKMLSKATVVLGILFVVMTVSLGLAG